MQLAKLLDPVYAQHLPGQPFHGGLAAPLSHPAQHGTRSDGCRTPLAAEASASPTLAPQPRAKPAPSPATTPERALSLLGFRAAELAPLRRCAQRQASARVLSHATPLLRVAGFADNGALVRVVCIGGPDSLNALVHVHAELLQLGLAHDQLCTLGAQPYGAAALRSISQNASKLLSVGFDVPVLVALALSAPEMLDAVAACAARLCDVGSGSSLPLLMRYIPQLSRMCVSAELVWTALDHADGGRTLEALLENFETLRSFGLDDGTLVLLVRAGTEALREVSQAAGHLGVGTASAPEALVAAACGRRPMPADALQ